MQKHPVQSLLLIGWGAKIPPTSTQVNRICKTASQGTRQRKAGRSWVPRFEQSATCTLGAGTWVGLNGWGLSRRRNMAMISSPYGEGISLLDSFMEHTTLTQASPIWSSTLSRTRLCLLSPNTQPSAAPGHHCVRPDSMPACLSEYLCHFVNIFRRQSPK